MERAVPEETETSGIGGYIPSNMARPLGSEVKGEDVPLLPKILICDFEDDSSVADEDPGNGVKAADLVKAVHADNDLVKDGDRATDEAGIASLGDNG